MGAIAVFVFVTIILGGLAAFVAGRTVAATWRPVWQVPVYMLLLACAVRFIHFSIFGAALLAPLAYAIDYAVLLILAMAGYLLMRRQQMDSQYGWRGTAGARS